MLKLRSTREDDMKHVRFLEGAEEQGSVSTRCGNDYIVDMSN